MILFEETEGYRVALIPFARLDDNSTRAYLVAFRPGDEWKFILVNREYFKQILQTENPADFTQDKTFYAIAFLWLDEMLFGNTDTDIEEWLLDNGSRAPELTSQNQIETRCIVNHVVIWRCYRIIRAIRHPENPIDFRSPCTDGEILQGFIATFVNCGGSSGGGSSGSLFNPSSNWFGGGEGTGMGSGTFGGFGAGPSVFNHPYLAPIFSHCSLVEQAANGENAANITFTQEELEGCQQLTTIASQLFITPDNLAWLHYNNPSALQAIAAYLNSSNVSALERQALDAWAALLAAGKTNLLLRQFMPLYLLVYGEIVPALGLNANEAEFLLLSGNGALANEIKQFLEEEGASPETHTAASLVFRAINQDVLEGPYTETFQQLLNQYPEYANDPLMGLKVAIEVATLKAHHPEWSNFRLAATALLNVTLEQLHLQLDILGLFPVAGEIADLTNAGIYALQGDWFNAGLSASGAIPVAGWFSTGAKLAIKAAGSGKKIILKSILDQSTGLIHFGNRNQLRRVLQTPSGHQAHHIVPWGKTNHPVIQKAASPLSDKAFHPNEIFNGINLPESRHLGSHPNYDNLITQRLNAWQDAYPNATPEQAANSIRQWLQTLKSQIQTSTAHINAIVPPAIPFVP